MNNTESQFTMAPRSSPAPDEQVREYVIPAPESVGEQVDVATEEMLVNMGPQHPSTHGVLRVVLRTDGEVVLEAVPHIGYLHRCAEKIAENVAYYQYVPYTDRMDYVAGMNENWAFCRAVEKLAGIELPRRAEFIRIIICELNRIASHLVSFGTYGLDIGAFTPFLYAFREREYILDLFEMVCGARLTYSYFTIGGSTHDLPRGYLEKVVEFLDYFEPKLVEYNDLLSWNHIFIKRTANVGIISPKLCTDYALTGPVIRGSGIPYDLRRLSASGGPSGDEGSYSLYPELDFEVCVGRGEVGTVGDCWDRYIVRMQEMAESCRIIRQCIAKIPPPGDGDGRYRVKLPRNFKPPAGEIYVETENPRGVLGFYVESQGGTMPYRCKARAATFCNLSVTHEVCRNVLLADVPAIIGSIDVVMGQVDR
ncbi:MAG: NADH-quinone oxidoreductase subunit D [Phycisphaeraceae bacterium]|nr:NADH-quinone oxidoreductase subunit D [Phycisphaeraceae bacterium]